MTKSLIFKFAIILCSAQLWGQFSPEKIISTETLGAWTVYAGDIDGDGLADVASANRFSDDITWFKNLGNGQFGPLNLIAPLDQPLDVNGADIDGDGDIDILATAPFSNLLVWYENLDGLGTFSSQKIISDETITINDVQAGDIDNDGDIDLVTGSSASGVAWHENLDGVGNFSPKQVINENIANARAVSIVDIDQDGDKDVVATSSGNFTLSWYENTDGQGTFGPIQILAGSALTKTAVIAHDINEDNLEDLVVATFADNKVEWFENLGGAGNFASPQIITTEAMGAISVFVTDLDNDGDMDALSASRNDNKVAWYENFTVLSIDEVNLKKIELYPNPTKDFINLVIPENLKLDRVRILDIAGKIVQEAPPSLSQIDMSKLSQGIYFIQLSTGDRAILKKVIVR